MNIRPLNWKDLAFLVEVRNECREHLHNNAKFTLEEALEWYFCTTPKFFMIEEQTTPIGYFRTSNWDIQNGHVTVGMDLHVDYRGKHLSKSLYIAFMHTLFKEFQFHKLDLEVLEGNSRAMQLYLDLGFKVDGYKRDEIKRDKCYHTSVVMSILKEEFYENTSADVILQSTRSHSTCLD